MKNLWPALLALVSPALLSAEAGKDERGASSTVTAIGDVHGDLQTFRALLRSTSLIDKDDHWSGGARRLVQTGDLLDRGPDSRATLELLMRLEKEAQAEGGGVVVLMGNHEAMNIIGDLRYTTQEEFAAFQKEEKPEERARRREKILSLVKRGSPLLAGDYYQKLALSLDEKSFDRLFPPGYFGHRAAFGPSGRYGRWLLEKRAIHREERTLFVHAGLSPSFGTVPIDELNLQVKSDLLEYLEIVKELEEREVFERNLGLTELEILVKAEQDAGGPLPELRRVFQRLVKLLQGAAFSEDGPLWYRGLALGNERLLGATVKGILRFHDSDRIVIGHTQPSRLAVEGRFGNRVILIDTGMNQKLYGGCPSALLLSPGGRLRVLK